jgi:dipeptidyl aminopeptidase/acylaminoacyl peptidase
MRVINYTREDGVLLSGTLYLPEGFDGSERLPLLMSAYPREFLDIATASQSSRSDNRYIRPFGSSNFYMCLSNVAVLVDASFPIVGDTETVNNTFIEQSIMNAKAAIDYLDEQGIIDRDKVVIQGHSYGAFMVLNLMAHSDLFAGGIAQNGAYNRTLTPFGFQSERRTLWQAREQYINLSPFLFANQINKPLLLIHSTDDTNSGTFPLQSRRLFEALDGLGKIARYVQLPTEGHHYRARETHLHVLWEYKRFFDEFIR